MRLRLLDSSLLSSAAPHPHGTRPPPAGGCWVACPATVSPYNARSKAVRFNIYRMNYISFILRVTGMSYYSHRASSAVYAQCTLTHKYICAISAPRWYNRRDLWAPNLGAPSCRAWCELRADAFEPETGVRYSRTVANFRNESILCWNAIVID